MSSKREPVSCKRGGTLVADIERGLNEHVPAPSMSVVAMSMAVRVIGISRFLRVGREGKQGHSSRDSAIRKPVKAGTTMTPTGGTK